MTADLKPDTIRQYASAIRTHVKFCSTRCLQPATSLSVENHLRDMWDRGILQGTPLTLRSAIRRACKIHDRPDPFTQRLDLFIDAFQTDKPLKDYRFIEPTHLDQMRAVFSSFTDVSMVKAALLFMITLHQNVRIRTLMAMTFNDLMPESGTIWIAHAKKHGQPFLTIVHPLAEEGINELYEVMGRPPPFTKLSEGWTEVGLNEWLSKVAEHLDLPYNPTWHWVRHSSTQRMNDLGYPNPISRALGTWKRESSMKIYIRCRTPFPYSRETRVMHAKLIETLTARLQQHRGKMMWMVQPKGRAASSSCPPLL
jgi:hypothetical protein